MNAAIDIDIYVEGVQEFDMGDPAGDERTQTTGVILCDQAKMRDLKAGNAQIREACPEDIWEGAKDLIISFM